MVSCCNRRLYKGNSYEICIPITDTGVTSVRFYTSGDVVIEKEGEIVDDTMCFELTKEELDLLPDGVLRYSYEDFDSNTRYVVVTPGDYSGTTLDDLLEDAFDSGYTAGQEDCSGDTCEGVFESGYTSGHTDGIAEQKAKMTELDVDNGDLEMSPGGVLEKDFYNTDGWNHVWVAVDTIDWWNSGYTSGYTDGLNACSGGNEDLIANLENDYFVIPEGTTKLRDYAFFASSLSSITIPSSVTEIGRGVFENTQLTGITIPSSIHTIMDLAFDSTRLEEIVVPDTVSTLGAHAFHFCNYLTAATLPSGLTAITNYLFSNTSLTGITLPTGITSIGNYAFEKTHLTGNIVIPSSVRHIYSAAFDGCSGLTSMTFESPVPPNIIMTPEYYVSLGSSSYTWPIYVPCEAVEDYKTAWPYYAHRISCQQEPEPEPAYSAMPLTFRILSDGYINWNVKNVTTTFDDPNAREPDFQRTIYYSKDSGNTWNSVTSTTGGTHIPVLSGETVLFKGDNNKYSVTFGNSTNFSGTTCEYDVYGNIMSLINSTGYTSLTALTEQYQFFALFGDTPVRSAEHLILPAMELTQQCYRDMFIRCTNLTTAPVLPAQYIPASGYYFMFYGCNHLTYIKCLATSIGVAATNSWVGPDNPPDNPVQPGLPRHGTFVKSPDMHDWDVATEENYITHGIPLGWTVVDDQS